MIEISQRTLTQVEKSKLQKILPGFWVRIQGFIVKFLFIFMFSFIPILLVDEFIKLNLAKNGFFAFSWTLLSIIIALFLTWREEKFVNRQIIFDELKANIAEIWKIEISQVFIAEVPRLGWAYFMQVSDNQTIIINSQLYEIFEIKPDVFPSSKFLLTVSPYSTYILDIETIGESIPPQPSIVKQKDIGKKMKRKILLSLKSPVKELLILE